MSAVLRCIVFGALAMTAACGGVPGGLVGRDLEIEGSAGEDRIIGGAAYVGIPGVGALRLNGSIRCTATLVSSREIVTAAHCLDGGYPFSNFDFAIGAESSAPENVYGVIGGAQHPTWNRDTLLGDIAYMILDRDATELPLKVLDKLDSTWEGSDLTFVGYGADDGDRKSGAGIKRKVIIPISQVSATQFLYATAGRNVCNGDSGGPAFFVDPAGNHLLVGATSFGDPQCLSYGVDTTVSAYLGWLGLSGTRPQSTPTAPPSDPCGSVTFEGSCSGNTVTWCENGSVYQADCTPRNKTCAYSQLDGFYGCTAQPLANDPCHGETYRGRCSDSETVVWCENGQAFSIDCGEHGGSCGYNQTRGIYNCAY